VKHLLDAPGLTDKDCTILVKLARDKHSCLLRTLVKQLKPRTFGRGKPNVVSMAKCQCQVPILTFTAGSDLSTK
jgi:hypothetical protein